VQLYANADDGRRAHRHADPLNIALFAAGREVIPDLGYIADHPANAWVRCTAAHNTVVVDGESVTAAGPGRVQGWAEGEDWRFADLSVPAVVGGERRPLAAYRRAVLLLALPREEGLVLVDLFDVAGGTTHDYVMRVNDPEQRFRVPGRALRPRDRPLYQDVATPPAGFRTAGFGEAPFVARWGDAFSVAAHVLAPCDEVIAFRSPAWRNAREVFADPHRAWDTLCLRRQGRPQSRFVVVYEVAPRGREHP